MKWTKQTPMKPGLYWLDCGHPDCDECPDLVFLFFDKAGAARISNYSDGVTEPVEDCWIEYGAQHWYGPVTHPPRPTP